MYKMIFCSVHCQKVYNSTAAFDPEGILGTLTSIFLCFLGLQVGVRAVNHQSHVLLLLVHFFYIMHGMTHLINILSSYVHDFCLQL